MTDEEKHYVEVSSCSSAESEQSDKRKRLNRSTTGDGTGSLKPYKCRFCQMKFTKSQALGGHMNRHREEREREQVINAQKLLLQQDLPYIMMSEPNYSLQRSLSEGSLKSGLPFLGGNPSLGGGLVQPNTTYNNSSTIASHGLIAPPRLAWNVSTTLGNKSNTSMPTIPSLDQISQLVPQIETKLAYGISPSMTEKAPQEDGASLYKDYMMPMMNTMCHDTPHEFMILSNIQDPDISYESHMQSLQRRGSKFPDQCQGGAKNQQEKGGDLSVASGIDLVSLMPEERLTIHHQGSLDPTRKTYKLSQALAFQHSHLISHKNPHAYSSSSSNLVTSAIPSMCNTLDFNNIGTGLGNQCIDGSMWLLGNYSAKPLPSSLNEYESDIIEATYPKINIDESSIDDSVKQSKIMRWDLSLHNQYDFDDVKVARAFTLPGLTSSHIGADYDVEGEGESACSQESKMQ